MTVGGILGEAWALYKAHWRHFIPLALIFYVVLSLATLGLTVALGWVGALISALVSLIGFFWLQGALTEAVSDVRDGRADLSLAETFRRVQPRIWALLGAGILAVLGIAVGLVLLIVPGLLLLTWWSLVVPAIVLEKRGVMESFGRSRELVRGHAWTVFGVVIVTVLISFLVGLLIGAALLFLPDELATFASDVISGTITAPFGALAWTLMYFALRDRQTVPGEPTAAAV